VIGFQMLENFPAIPGTQFALASVDRRFGRSEHHRASALQKVSTSGITMITCIIRYHIDPTKKRRSTHARIGASDPRAPGRLIGYFPHRRAYARSPRASIPSKTLHPMSITRIAI